MLRRDSVYPLLAAAMFLTAGVFGARPLISYRALALGAAPLEIGLIASSFAILGLLGAVPVGRLTDRFGGRLLTIAGCTISGAVLLGIGFANSLVWLAIAQAGLGLGQLMMAIGSHTLVTSRSMGRRRDRDIGLYAAAASIGVGLGPIAFGFIAGEDVAGPRGQLVFVVAGGLAFLAAVSAAVMPRDVRSRREDDLASAPMTFRATLRLPWMRPAILASIVVLSAWDILVAYLPVYGEERGILPQAIGLAVGTLALSGLASRLILSRLIGRFGYIAVLASSMAIPALAIPLLLLRPAELGLFAVMALAGFGLGLGQPVSIVLVALAAPRRSLGYAMSLRLVGNRLGQLTVPALVGATAGQAGVGAIFATVAAMLALGAVGVATDRRVPRDRAEESGDQGQAG